MNTLENIYAILLSVQMTASNINESARADSDTITLLSGIAENIQHAADIAADILDEYFKDAKSAEYTKKVSDELKSYIEESEAENK